MKKKIREYEGDDLAVTFDIDRCIHAAECARGLPQVFDPERRPWIDTSQAAANKIVEVIHRCPTGA